ncbi:uncharacterized protein K452DRAFT_301331 [Aplosporella prunicola CBS 121167]|uniref:Uncharacterized protein n=1 Tax=Aplosporella prunicola CBS 121167 TaxID=1176127 RepID=A0A6A6B2H6_9PEZI|nr:uncharacterized protein K452DRAFT_301331 [Aplosporella prunicola CBS 121167]KAF2138389.1 hypothetical protein K452DRAFT_301331 [Aplosporella prunicola CBS 121167]
MAPKLKAPVPQHLRRGAGTKSPVSCLRCFFQWAHPDNDFTWKGCTFKNGNKLCTYCSKGYRDCIKIDMRRYGRAMDRIAEAVTEWTESAAGNIARSQEDRKKRAASIRQSMRATKARMHRERTTRNPHEVDRDDELVDDVRELTDLQSWEAEEAAAAAEDSDEDDEDDEDDEEDAEADEEDAGDDA